MDGYSAYGGGGGFGANANPYGQNYSTGGGAAAGGFMTGGSPFGGSQGSPGGSRSSKSNNLRPVTIRQIINATQPNPDAEFTIDGVEVGQITFVAAVRNFSKLATNYNFSVEDGTGQIDVRQWLDSQDDDSGKASGVQENVYIRVLGSLKTFSNKRHVNAAHMRVITDFNEIQYHFLEAISVHLQLTKGPLHGQGGQTAGAIGDTTSAGAYSAYALGAGQGAGVGAGAGAGAGGEQYAYLPLPAQRKIMQFVHDRMEGDNEVGKVGVHVQEIARALPVFAGQVQEQVEHLISEGVLYTTSNDNYVLPTS